MQCTSYYPVIQTADVAGHRARSTSGTSASARLRGRLVRAPALRRTTRRSTSPILAADHETIPPEGAGRRAA